MLSAQFLAMHQTADPAAQRFADHAAAEMRANRTGQALVVNRQHSRNSPALCRGKDGR